VAVLVVVVLLLLTRRTTRTYLLPAVQAKGHPQDLSLHGMGFYP
jgi:hypothetical protein